MAKSKRATARTSAVAAGAQRPAMSASSQDSTARAIAWWALLAMVFVTPIIISNWTWLGFQLPFTYDQFDIIKVFVQRVLTLVALTAWVWDLSTRGGKVRHTPIDWLILVFLAWVTVSTIQSIHPATAFFGKYRRFEGLLSFINYAVIYFLVVQLATTKAHVFKLAKTVFWAGIVVAGYGVLQSLGADPLAWGKLPFEANRAFSTYGNPDLLGGFLMFSTFISLGLAFAEEQPRWRAVYWVGSLLNIWCVIAAFTRSAWVGSVAGIVFLVLFAVRQRVRWTKTDWGFSAAIAAVAGVVIGRSLTNPNEVMNFGKRVVSIFQFTEGSAATRFQIWGAAWRAVQDSPLFGFGPDTFRLLFPIYKPVEYVAAAGYLSVADNVHNYPLQLATGIGIPGVLLFFGVVGWVAVRSWPLAFSADKSAQHMLFAGIWAACAAYVVHLFFGLSVTGASFLLWVFMGALVAPSAIAIDVPKKSWGLVVAVAMAALALVGVGYQVAFISADTAYLQSRVSAQGAQRTELAIKAVRLNPFNDIYRAEIGVAATDEFIAIISSGGSSSEAGAAFEAAEAAFLETIAFAPPEYDNYVFLTNLYNIAGDVFGPEYYDKAIDVGLRGIAVERYGPAIRLQIARAYMAQDRLVPAQMHLAYAVKMDPNYAQAGVELGKVYFLQGEVDKAIEVLNRYPDSPEAVAQLELIEAAVASASVEATP